MGIRSRALAALQEMRKPRSTERLGSQFRGRRYRGNTFGPAGPCLTYTAKERGEWAQQNSFATIENFSVPSSVNVGASIELEAIFEWAGKIEWDVAAVLHIPKSLMAVLNQTCVGADEITLSRKLRHCFNKLDREVFRNRHRRGHTRVRRFVTLEKASEVGWHANVLLQTPRQVDRSGLALKLQRLWLDQLRGFDARLFDKHLFWAEIHEGGFLRYSLKHIDSHGVVDWNNVSLA